MICDCFRLHCREGFSGDVNDMMDQCRFWLFLVWFKSVLFLCSVCVCVCVEGRISPREEINLACSKSNRTEQSRQEGEGWIEEVTRDPVVLCKPRE